MKMGILTLSVLTALSMISANARAVIVTGAPSCGKWVHDRQQDAYPAVVDESWLVGYLSGIAHATQKDFLKGTNNDSLYLWVNNYCQANPLSYLDEAGDHLALELIRRAGQ
jgi:hypothetical protein